VPTLIAQQWFRPDLKPAEAEVVGAEPLPAREKPNV
jgi:hypothetical protein